MPLAGCQTLIGQSLTRAYRAYPNYWDLFITSLGVDTFTATDSNPV